MSAPFSSKLSAQPNTTTLTKRQQSRRMEADRADFRNFVPDPEFRLALAEPLHWTEKPQWYLDFLDQGKPFSKLDMTALFGSLLETPNQVIGGGIPPYDAYWCFYMLDTTPSIQLLNLSKCGLTPNLLASLALVLKRNTTLQYLDISGNLLTFEVLKRFLLTIQLYNYTLLQVQFSVDFDNSQYDEMLTSFPGSRYLHDLMQFISRRNAHLKSVRIQIRIP